MPEVEEQSKNDSEYDFDYITQALGLIPIQENEAAINPGAITDIARADDGQGWNISLQGGDCYTLTDEEMCELEETIRARSETAKEMQREQIKANIKMQADAMAELSGAVAPGVIVGAPTNRRFRQ